MINNFKLDRTECRSYDYNYEDVQTSLEVVFEERENVFNNWSVFEEQWLPAQICH